MKALHVECLHEKGFIMNFTITRISDTGYKVTNGSTMAFVSYYPATDELKVLSGRLFDHEIVQVKDDIKQRLKRGF